MLQTVEVIGAVQNRRNRHTNANRSRGIVEAWTGSWGEPRRRRRRWGQEQLGRAAMAGRLWCGAASRRIRPNDRLTFSVPSLRHSARAAPRCPSRYRLLDGYRGESGRLQLVGRFTSPPGNRLRESQYRPRVSIEIVLMMSEGRRSACVEPFTTGSRAESSCHSWG